MEIKKVLIIDDDEYKASNIKKILENIGINDISISKSRNSGIRSLRDNKYDLLILDNCFPVYDNSYPERDMGLSLLHHFSLALSYKEVIKDTKIIMCSSDKLEIPEYDNLNILGSVQYNSSVYMDPYFEELIKMEE